MNRKMRRLALRSALSAKAADEQVLVMDSLDLMQAKTKEMGALLQRLGVNSTALILLAESNATIELAARNLPSVKTLRASCLNVRDLLGYDTIIMPLDAVAVVHNWLGAKG